MPFDALRFVAENGVVLAAAKGPVPNIAEAIAGEPMRGSWWGHRKGSEIFRALATIDDSPDVLCFRLIAGKITFVHRRLWPALVCLADELGKDALTAIRQEHTPSGAHRNVVTPFPDWVPADAMKAAKRLDAAAARAQLGSWMNATAPRPRRTKQSGSREHKPGRSIRQR
jgi:hypothetical protein